MTHLRVVAVMGVLLSTQLSTQLGAQRLEDVATGTTVRVWQGTPTIAVVRGTLLSADTINVVVGSDRTAIKSIPYQEITRFEYIASRRTKDQARARGMLHGAAIGLGTTTILMMGALVLSQSPEGEACSSDCWNGLRLTARAGITFTAATTAIGAVIGSRRVEQWRRVRLPWS
jgi:hypothetical protein